MWRRGKFAFVLITLQVLFLIIFVLFVKYHPDADPSTSASTSSDFGYVFSSLHRYYSMFQDITVMTVVGFGFSMAVMKQFSYSGICMNLLIYALSFQWSFIVQNCWKLHNTGYMYFDIISMIQANIASISVLVSLRAVFGKANPLQLVVMSLIEIALFSCNQHLGLNILKVSDAGNSIFVHTFGAYFGLAVSFQLFLPDFNETTRRYTSYKSNLVAFIGIFFLWIYWPSYNAALTMGHARYRVIINTFLTLLSCTVTTFALSSLLGSSNKFDIVHIENSTIAAGVAIGSAVNMMTEPYGAMMIGILASIVSVVGFRYLSPILSKRLKLPDTIGVHNVHGLPGVMGGIIGFIMTLFASEDTYKYSIYELFPAMAPKENSTKLEDIHFQFQRIEPGYDRSNSQQAVFQLLVLGCTLLIAIIGGLLTGVLLKLSIWDPLKHGQMCGDCDLWEVRAHDTEYEEHSARQEREQ